MTKIPSKNLVLYADDDPDDLTLVTEAFQKYSHNVEVVTVNDGIEALSYLKNLPEEEPSPCLVILDINMPRLGGKDVLKRVREIDRFEETPIILFTTSSMQQDKEFAVRYKAGFLSKPIDVRQMEVITDLFIDHCTEEIRKNIKRRGK
jgi:CheY-like chemotaxis protein